MIKLTIRMDMRTPGFANSPKDYYRTGLDMVEWADQQGFTECMLSEHHGTNDNYLPSPLVYAGAIAARTENIRIRISALILPLHDPLRVAEDVAVLDHISQGRIELVVAAGFRPSEFAMFDREFAKRGELMEEGVVALKQAWRAEPFDYRGRNVCITPKPLQDPHPLLLMGGSTKIAARRAARLGDGFVPAVAEIYPAYLEECEKLGIKPGDFHIPGSSALFVAENPDEVWEQVAPHAVHETNSYARWYAETNTAGPYQPIENPETLRESGIYQVLTPQQCLDLAESLGPNGWLFLQPLLGGLAPKVGWKSLNLFAEKVLPELRLMS